MRHAIRVSIVVHVLSPEEAAAILEAVPLEASANDADPDEWLVRKGGEVPAGHTYRGKVDGRHCVAHGPSCSQCVSLLVGDECCAHSFPYIEVKQSSAQVEHEAYTSKIGEDQLFYCRQRGISAEDAVSMIVHGFCRDVFKELPMEYVVEARNLLSMKLEGSVG